MTGQSVNSTGESSPNADVIRNNNVFSSRWATTSPFVNPELTELNSLMVNLAPIKVRCQMN